MWTVSRDEEIKRNTTLQSQRKVDIVLALDDTSFVEAGESVKQNNLYGAIVYGIGNSTEAVYYLDARWAECLIVPDEFTAGYQCVAETVNALRKTFYQMKNQEVPYTVLTRDNLFQKRIRTCYLHLVSKIYSTIIYYIDKDFTQNQVSGNIKNQSEDSMKIKITGIIIMVIFAGTLIFIHAVKVSRRQIIRFI